LKNLIVAFGLLVFGLAQAQYYDPYRGSRNQDSRQRSEKRERDAFYDRQVSEIRDTYSQRLNAINSAFSGSGSGDRSSANASGQAPVRPNVPIESQASVNLGVFSGMLRKAEAGDAQIMAAVAHNYEIGRPGIPKNMAEARRWFLRAAEAGDKNAMAWLANDASGHGEGKYDEAAHLKWAIRATDAGLNSYAEAVVFAVLVNGQAPTDAQRLALYKRYLDKGVAENQTWALGRWGVHAIKGELGYSDAGRGVEALSKAANSGDEFAQSKLGYFYLNGTGVAKDRNKGISLLLAAADKGEANAMFTVGRYLSAKNDGWPYDPKRAALYLQKMVDKPDQYFGEKSYYAEAAKTLAYCFRPGAAPCGENPKKYFELMKVAAQQGSKIASHELAFCFGRGIGVERNDALALKEWVALDQAGYPPATYQIGYYVYNGRGTQENEPLAWDYIAQAAAKGYVAAAKWVVQEYAEYAKMPSSTGPKGTKEQFQALLKRNEDMLAKDPLIWSKEDWPIIRELPM
jgi:uncharacterized protein